MSEILKTDKIAFFIQDLKGGGAERVFLNMANEFSRRKTPIDFVTAKLQGAYLPLMEPGVNLVDLKVYNLFLSLPLLAVYLIKEKPKVLFVTGQLASIVAVMAAILAGRKTKVVVRVAVNLSMKNKALGIKQAYRLVSMLVIPLAELIYAVSDDTAKDTARYLQIDEGRVRTIYNPVITPDMEEKKKEAVDHPWFQDDRSVPVITAMGRLTHQKDFKTLIRAFHLVQQQMPARLFIMGAGEMEEELRRLSASLGLEDKVELPGFIVQPFKYLSKSDVFVLSSRWEGLPGAIIQAMACGCPVISTDCPGGSKEILAGGKYGELVAIGDQHEMAEAVIRVLQGGGKQVDPAWLNQFRLEDIFHHFEGLIE